MDGDDADQILILGQDHRDETVASQNRLLHAVEDTLLLLAQGVAIDPLIGDDCELRGVDRVSAFAQNLALRTFLATAFEKFPHILKVGFVLGVVGCKHLGGPE